MTFTDQDLLLDKIINPDGFTEFLSRCGAASSITADEILQNPRYTYGYARYVLKRPWSLGEPAIAQDPKLAYWYALSILRGPFPLGEPVIAQHPEWSRRYQTLLNYLI